MARRIFFLPLIIALIWSGALIATKAIADRECFEDSCREVEVAEPAPAKAEPDKAAPDKSEPNKSELAETAPVEPAQAQAAVPPAAAAVQASAVVAGTADEVAPPEVPREIPMTVVSEPVAPAAPANASASAAAPAPAAPVAVVRPDYKLAPASALPKVVAEPAPPKVVSEPAPRYTPPQTSTRAEDARIRREPERVAPVHAEPRKPAVAVAPAPAPVGAPVQAAAPVAAPPARPARAVNVAVPAYVRSERPPQPAYVPPAPAPLPAGYVAQQRPSVATAAVVEVPGEIQTGDGLVTVYPNLRPDPAWKLCQIDSRDLGRRSYRCTAYSYHPYGEGGYRPYGAYRNYAPQPGYVVAPNAKIISLEPRE